MEAPVEVHIFLKFTFLIVLLPLRTTGTENSGDNFSRRTLHEPLFPTDPPSPTQTFPSTPMQPGSPFFSPGQPQSPTQTQTISAPTNVSDYTRTQSESVKSAGKIFIGVSISIVAVVLIVASACFIHHHLNWNSTESEKTVRGGGAIRQQNASGYHNHQIPAIGAPAAGTHILYIGTLQPFRGRDNETKNSPYHKLRDSNDRIDYHRPSPELHPLPPLTGIGEQSPPQEMASDDEESYHTAKASLAGRNFGPRRLALQQSFGNSTTTTATCTTRSNTNTTTSLGKAGRTSPAAWAAVESSSTAIKLITFPSPQLQPMSVPKQLPNSQSDPGTDFRSLVSLTATLPAPLMQTFQTRVGSSPASPPLTPMEGFQTKTTQKEGPSLPPTPPPPPPPPPPSSMQAFLAKRRIQSLLMSPVPPPPVQSLRIRTTQKVQESPSSSPPSDQSLQAKALQENQSRSEPPPWPPLPLPHAPLPPLPPPPPHESPSPRPPSSAVQLQHPILNNKNRLPEPCPPSVAASRQAEIREPNIPKNGTKQPFSSGPSLNANLDQSSKKLSEEAENDNLEPRLKPLHWDQVKANSDCEILG